MANDNTGNPRLEGIKRIAIIGAGNAGITAAKYLVAEDAFEQIDVYEQRSDVGGLWIYTPENDVETYFCVPQTEADAPLDTPIWREASSDTAVNGHGPGQKEPTFISPLYERLEANLPKSIMRHSDFGFAEDEQLFPTQEAILEHLERYGDDVRHLIRFETQVQNISCVKSAGRSAWLVTTRYLPSSEEVATKYDAVVVSSGHFNVPYIPDVPGIRQWNEAYPGAISHSKHFRRPEDFANKKVISIGKGYSGLDIAHQLGPVVQPPLHVSTHDQTSVNSPDGTVIHHPEISEFLPPTSTMSRAVRFADGHIEREIDDVVFCTGYLYSFPFLPDFALQPIGHMAAEDAHAAIITDGARPRNLYQYMLYNENPTLAIISMPQQIVPFPIAEAQSAVVARLWAGRLTVPNREAMRQWEKETVAARGEGKKWLWLRTPLDGQYLNMLADWASSADDDAGGQNGATGTAATHQMGKQGGRKGKAPPRWGEKEMWIRARVGEIKRAFVDRGAERCKVQSMEELGFDFEAWKKAEHADA